MECGFVDCRYLTDVIPLGSLDPKAEHYAQRGAPAENLEEIQFNLEKPRKTFKIKKLLYDSLRTDLLEFIQANQGDFS